MTSRAIVLAGGDSSRMGSPKALLDYGGQTFLKTILSRLAEAGITDRTVVLGKHAAHVQKEMDLTGVRVVVNPEPARGQLSSLQEALRGQEPAGTLVCLVDHPSVSVETYRGLAARLAQEPGAIVLTRYHGKHGHPIALGAPHVAFAVTLPPTSQMREVLKSRPDAIRDHDVVDDGVRWDVDTPEDYQRLIGPRSGAGPLAPPTPALTDGHLMERLSHALHAGKTAALVTVIDTVGSSPRPVGTKMLVHADGRLDGTIGGGTLEALAIREALLAIDARKPRRARFNLGATGPRSIGMFCGGEVEVFVDVVAQPLRLLILGAGHVGERLGRVAEVLGLRYSVADDRAEYASRERYPQAEEILAADLPAGLAKLEVDASTYVVVATRCHTIDLECVAWLLKTPARYIGMIGSVTKVRQVYKLLRERGIDAEHDPRLYAPVGLSLGSSEPGTIAVSVLAEIIKVHNGASGASLREGAPVKRDDASTRDDASKREEPAVQAPPVHEPPTAVVAGACSVSAPPPRSGGKKEEAR